MERFALTSPPSSWTHATNAVTSDLNYRLADLHEYSDFTSLFASYKLTGVKMQIYVSKNTVDEVHSSSTPGSAQIICYTMPNLTGQINTLNEQDFLDNASTRKRTLVRASGRPLTMYSRLRQLSEIHGTSMNTDYATIRPRWISTAEPSAVHTGQSIRIQYVNNDTLNNDYITIYYTYYIACKQAQ